MTMVSLSGPKVQEAIDIREQILVIDSTFLAVADLVLNDLQYANVSDARRVEVLREELQKAATKRDALIDLGQRRGVIG